jgi:hypothetical protein
MKKMIATMFVLFGAMTACIEDGAPLKQDPPDAGEPTTDPDATPPTDCPPDEQPPAAPTLTVTANPTTIMSGESTTVSWTSTNTEKCWSSGGDQPLSGSWPGLHPTTTTTYSLTCKGLDGSTVDGSATVTVTAPPPPPTCSCEDDCDDHRSWTGDTCDGNTDKCLHWLTDCGGLEVQVKSGQNITGSVTCGFWKGFGLSPGNAPEIGRRDITTAWMNAPTSSCSVDECHDSNGMPVKINIRIQFDGYTGTFYEYPHVIYNLSKGTFDGKNLQN